eukprot:2427689-Amphidinium_carterae.2
MQQHQNTKDVPPIWDGVDPEVYWRSKRREIRLWQEDSDLAKDRQGVRLFRALQGKAKVMADVLTDAQIRGPHGVEQIIAFFDQQYESHLRLQHEREFDELFFTGTRQNEETFAAYILRRTADMQRYETYALGTLPTHMKGKVMLKQARLSQAQLSRVLTWLDGYRDHISVSEALRKLDAEMELQSSASGAEHTGKSLWQGSEEMEYAQIDAGEWEGAEYWQSEYWWDDQEDPELMILYGEANDAGYASDCDEVWVYPWDLYEELDGEALELNLASFAAVQRAKMEKRKQRGFPSWGKDSKKGLTTFWPSSFGKSKGKSKGKGKSKNKDKDKGKDRFSALRDQRDDRRRQNGMMRVPAAKLHQRVRCWRCGQMGHMAANCSMQSHPQQMQHFAANESAAAASSSRLTQQQQQQQQTQRTAAKTFFVDFQSVDKGIAAQVHTGEFGNNFLLLPGNLSIVDTGAVNGLCGIQQFLSLDAVLRSHGLGVCRTASPQNLGGIGGSARVLAAAMVPISLASMCGILSVAICEVGAVINCAQDYIHWTHAEAQPCMSSLHRLQSGHCAISVVESLDSFMKTVPESERFRRNNEHERFAEELMRSLRQTSRASTRERLSSPVCFSLEDELETTAEACDDLAQCAAGHHADAEMLYRPSTTDSDLVYVADTDVTADHVSNLGVVQNIDHDEEAVHVMNWPPVSEHSMDENLLHVENFMMDDVCVAAQAQREQALQKRDGTDGASEEGHSTDHTVMAEATDERRRSGGRLLYGHDGGERSGDRLEATTAQVAGYSPCGVSASACDGTAGCVAASPQHPHHHGRVCEEDACKPCGSDKSGKAIRFEDCVEVCGPEYMSPSDPEAEGKLTCEMVELQQLSGALAKSRQRDDDRRLKEESMEKLCLMTDPEFDIEDEWQADV